MNHDSRISDEQLLSLLKEGDKRAFSRIYGRYYPLLYVYAYKLTGDEPVAKDIVQEVFVSLWEKQSEVDFSYSMSAYLYSAVRYQFLKQVRHSKVRKDYIEGFAAYLEEGCAATENYIREKELLHRIEELAKKLPGKMGKVFLLNRFENHSNTEIAAQLHISEKTAKNLLSMAIKNLRPMMEVMLLFALFRF